MLLCCSTVLITVLSDLPLTVLTIVLPIVLIAVMIVWLIPYADHGAPCCAILGATLCTDPLYWSLRGDSMCRLYC